ncbi:MAG TPA: amino acid adenylation domain-containing protein [Streptosporangiaceae bacterium]|nr:amino acid adenylation domain-containing protein [Streptosporangiaceae bacterium]
MTARQHKGGAFAGLLGMFREQAERNALATAVVDESESLTYQDLDRRSDLVARSLIACGMGPGELVAVSMRNSGHLIVALLGVLKAGAGYVPVCGEDPGERSAEIVASSKAGLMITDESGPFTAAPAALTTVRLTELLERGVTIGRLASPGGIDRPGAPAPDDTAYVIYTSGSTGNPKGVVIDHAALATYLGVARSEYPALAGRTLLHSSISFDMSVTSLFGPLVGGGTIEIGNLTELAAGSAPPHLSKPTFLKITPSHLPLLQVLPAWVSPSELLVIGGEALYREALQSWWSKHPGVAVINEYGPTEATVGCCIHRVEPSGARGGSVPIGVPADGTRLYVLDGEGREVPDGAAGELYIAGAQVARGYLHEARLSSQRFLPDPCGTDGSRRYRTGDLVRRDHSGTLEFLGREDDQVKIDGHRIELGEVERAILRSAAIVQAAVLATDTTAGSKRLSAFVRLAPRASLDATAIRGELAKILPAFMIPSRITAVSDFVLTANGKIDRARLSSQEAETFEHDDRGVDGARNLCRLVAEVTGANPVGADDDFLELGGSSVGAARLVGLARAAGIEIKITDVLRYRTVRGMLKHARPRGLASEEGT